MSELPVLTGTAVLPVSPVPPVAPTTGEMPMPSTQLESSACTIASMAVAPCWFASTRSGALVEKSRALMTMAIAAPDTMSPAKVATSSSTSE